MTLLKNLSLKMNAKTANLFYNEVKLYPTALAVFLLRYGNDIVNDRVLFCPRQHLNDFPLFSEAAKYFRHEERMIRIAGMPSVTPCPLAQHLTGFAARTVTLNIFSGMA